MGEAEAILFKEMFEYVKLRLRPKKKPQPKTRARGGKGKGAGVGGVIPDVEVLSREVVGSYDIAVVRENTPGKLNGWLEDEGYQPIQDGDDILDFYRRKGYVYACIKVGDAGLKADAPADLHPLRFTFKTGGCDGVYFPMKMTGLQKRRFDVNLYVFYRWWLNDKLDRYGYEERGFRRKYRDFDGPRCEPGEGKNWSDPYGDLFLRSASRRIGSVAKLFQELHPHERYYMTNIQAQQLDPAKVRQWKDDLWLFPYYSSEGVVPLDAREGGPAFAAYSD
jgi:Uncharacterized protein conserved in bacteria (DUF2330)